MSEPDLYALQQQLARRIDSFASNFLKTPRDRINLGYLKARSAGLTTLWEQFVNNHDAISAQASAEDLKQNDYYTSNVFDKYEQIYFDVLGRINEKVVEFAPPAPPAPVIVPEPQPQAANVALPDPVVAPPDPVLAPPIPMPAQLAHHIQIPRLNVPSFNGAYEDWPSFRDLFVAAVHSNPTLLPVHKLQYLKSLLTGSAESLLKPITTTADNYNIAWGKLQERFDNKRALINTTLRKFFNQRQADESAASIRQLLDTTHECLGALQIHGVDTSSWDSILVYVVSQHIPATSLDLWEQHIPRNQLPTIDGLLNFLEDRFRVLEFAAARTPTSSSRTRTKPQTFHTVSAGCRLCQGPQHPLRRCPKFLDMTPQQRQNYVTNAKLCKNCFAFSHQVSACKSAGTCQICGDRHHSLLHLPPSPTSNQAAPTPSSSAPSQATSSQPSSAHASALVSRPASSSSDEILLATALVVVKAIDGQLHSFRALLDNASQENFVSQRVLQFLGLKPHASSMSISGIGQSQAPKPLGEINFQFGSRVDTSFSMTINAIVLPVITNVLPAIDVRVSPQLVDQLELADPTYGSPGTIDILLSAHVFASLTLPSVRKAEASPTVALQTKLGWVLFGEATPSPKPFHRSCFHVASEDRVSAALQAFWRIEEVATASTRSPDDDKCEEVYANTHTRNADGRYCVQLPFKQQPPLLGASRERAVARFLQVERRLASNQQLRDDYAECINEYLQLGHMHPVSTSETDHRIRLPNGVCTQSAYYLPHHAVIKTESSTTKLRVVFDASCKSLNGVSLNDALLTGPVLQDSLVNLLLRWRIPRIVIKADIAKMYRQVLVADQHQPFQRIVWRNSPADELQDFQLRTVTFGTAAAPYLAIKTLQQLANDEAARFPVGAEMLKNDFYVDDLLSGAHSIEEAIDKQHQVTKILQCGGFEIRKWSSNHERVTDQLNDDVREICNNSHASMKALGIVWCPSKDTLSIKVSLLEDAVLSKRSLLSEVSKLFDPLGWIAPALICMKMLLQKLWLAGLNWDEILPASIQAEWTHFRRQLPAIETIAIPRWVKTSPHAAIELHGFSDASEKAYAAAVYVRVQISDDDFAVHLITAKTRVAPVKQVSLPRLELCGSVLLAKLLASVNTIFGAAHLHAWTDSEIVLAWLQGHPNRWTTFVANRVADIHNTLDASAWHHVPSKDNPADCASRGISPEQLATHPIWWHGPAWLAKGSSSWPYKQKKDIAATTLEAKRIQHSFVITTSNDTLDEIMNICSSQSKANRMIALLRRWRTRSKPSSPLFTVAEIRVAHNILLRLTQQTHFPEEYKMLTKNLPVSKHSKLASLNPFIDDDQLIRVGGRLQNANIPYSTRHPIIVPRKSRLTDLLINDAHIHTLHGSIALMQCHLRNQYWIIDARNVIRQTVHRCNICFRYSNPSLYQIMGQLPRPRVNITSPFSHTGIDYAGPMPILLRRSPGRPQFSKGYICLFVCLATKAIHLELVGDMTAATFLAALNRFTSRRGLPSDLYSDNGTYFIRAASDIDAELQLVLKKHTAEAAAAAVHKSTQWHFIPPAAPHFGGLWEAGVKSTKYHLKRIMGDGRCTYEELTTTLCQIESCLNSRPLCPISTDPDDFEILTPGHFLIGRSLRALPQPSVLEIQTNRLAYWQRIYQMTQRFWKQWQSEYLTRMQQRPKWATQSPDVEIGQLVLLKEDNLPPSQWKMARVTEIHRGPDDKVRVVTIKTPTSILKRPIVKICPLPSQ